jgi:hypothetical protein
MWKYNSDLNKWYSTQDVLPQDDFDFTSQELSATRYYSKCLSGASYIPVNSLDNLYDVIGEYKERNWYVGLGTSNYSNYLIPSRSPIEINNVNFSDYYEKYLADYGMTLKTLFTPNRLIKDQLSNFVYVDVATVATIDDLTATYTNLVIDGARLKEGHRVLIKDQITTISLLNTVDPNTFFIGTYSTIANFGASIEYSYYNETNGIYKFTNGKLVRELDLNDYENCKRYSVVVKEGITNRGKQFHLNRLLSGYFPSTSVDEPIYFTEKKNWIVRNRVDYNNLFEINYYDVIKSPTQSYTIDSVTYSIPQRTISVGEFGIILNNQEGYSNIINNKYKVNLRGISQTLKHYWICGDTGVLLRARKHDFLIDRIEVDCLCPRRIITTDLNSVSFYDDLRGAAVGDLGTILVTQDGGFNWERVRVEAFDTFNFNKVVYIKPNQFYIGGDAGIFVEMKKDISGWIAYRRRISRIIDDEDEYLLVDNINDLLYTNVNSWGLTFSYSTQSTSGDKELIFITTDDSKIIAYDLNDSIPNFDFVYFDFNKDYDDILNISRKQNSNTFYFTGIDISSGNSGLFSFDLGSFSQIGVGTSYSNTILSGTHATYESSYFPNEIFSYEDELIICGNNSLLRSSTFSSNFNFQLIDPGFEDRLKSKLVYLDYDAGSKLNFFDDFGTYRLPDSVTFSFGASAGMYIDFGPLKYGATAPSYLTQSEVNWFDYKKDREKTFEYYSSIPLSDVSKVEYSSNFIHATYSTLTASSMTIDINHVSKLAPSLLYGDEHSRYNGFGMTAIASPTQSFDIYMYDYIMVLSVTSSFSVSVGDVLRFESSVIDTNLLVNRIETISSETYVYTFISFNDNIIKELSLNTSSIVIKNLNRFNDIYELESNFATHPIGIGYDFIYKTASSYVEVSGKFNNLTSYYNLATNVYVYGDINALGPDKFTMSYTSGFLKFGYTPTYNLLDYLESINDKGDPNPTFYADKTYYSLPDYRGIPLQGVGNFQSGGAFIDYNGITFSGTTGNKILFGEDLKREWESILINTFVDVRLYDSPIYATATPSSTTERLLVMKKYQDVANNGYTIEFHKKLNFNLNDPLYFVDIISRRKLHQISYDLQELNNIGRLNLRNTEVSQGFTYNNYEKELNYKIPTDSYAKVLLSDVDTIENISSLVYIDYKNELSMNFTKLERDIEVPILNTGNYSGNLFIFCNKKHGLKTGDGVNLEFTGGTGSSQELNQNYFGYHAVIVANEYNFYLNIPYGNAVSVGNDIGFVRYKKRDPFLNFSPVDLIDLGVDGRAKQSIELTIENTLLKGDVFSLINVDFTKYRFRLIENTSLEDIIQRAPWLLEAEISGATIAVAPDGFVTWYKGTWECGRWFGGRWISGNWISGDWYDGIWDAKTIKDRNLEVDIDETSLDLLASVWFGGRWFNGTWNGGTWVNGRWYGGNWNNGLWYRGIWNDGTWNNGLFMGGIWVLGTWNNGIFNTDVEPAYWLDGRWYGGDFENGMWYNGQWEEKNAPSRFGVNSFNSRTATWHGGKWLGGSFYSRLNLDSNGEPDVSDIHKYSIWYTGQWLKGDFYGGIAYNIDWKSGTWHGGILEDIQVIGFTGSTTTSENYFVTNGIFKFNIGDQITIIDNNAAGSLGVAYGNNSIPQSYTVLYTVEDNDLDYTNVYVNRNITLNSQAPVDTKLRVVSVFSQCNWKSGVWTNGIYKEGLWEGGIWYNGVFEATWM